MKEEAFEVDRLNAAFQKCAVCALGVMPKNTATLPAVECAPRVLAIDAELTGKGAIREFAIYKLAFPHPYCGEVAGVKAPVLVGCRGERWVEDKAPTVGKSLRRFFEVGR